MGVVLRVESVQAEYLMTRFADPSTGATNTQKDLRLSAGLVSRSEEGNGLGRRWDQHRYVDDECPRNQASAAGKVITTGYRVAATSIAESGMTLHAAGEEACHVPPSA
jgi:hypothetical protein